MTPDELAAKAKAAHTKMTALSMRSGAAHAEFAAAVFTGDNVTADKCRLVCHELLDQTLDITAEIQLACRAVINNS